MGDGTIVLDVGKTYAKVSLWEGGALVERKTRPNAAQHVGYRALDVQGIDAWLMESLRALAHLRPVGRIIPVGHGAAAALLQGERLFVAPMDYEEEIPAAERSEYEQARDPFADTGSPALPLGLNLGMQLHHLEMRLGPLPDDVTIVPWPQYWAWRLCGVMASEVTSLGCHTDLWCPATRQFSALAIRRGWAKRMAPLRAASDVLGAITPQLAQRTGLPRDCVVLCGLHDSNAALLAARAHREMSAADATVLSTGTWFIAMRSVGAGKASDLAPLQPQRDCLVNVDVRRQPVPSARFMGGREAQLIGGIDVFAPAADQDPQAQLARLPQLIASGACAYPSFAPGVGPFGHARGEWCNEPAAPHDRRILASVYLALVADASLELIGSRDRLLIEGRFAEDVIFTRVLATLRPQQQVFTTHAHQDVAYGALRLVDPQLQVPDELARVQPLEMDLRAYATQWQARAHAAQGMA